ncbi:MAG TPA: phosphoribosylanthranilate isomerase [Porticoccaceae bacterium]|nr:phosphoribosylanthranilate isomerase [Porticoccaceae bacterium]
MTKTFAKICGINRIEDALAAVDAGADALGLVFHPPSPRAVTIAQAAAIVAAVGPFVTTVALFVDAEASRVQEVLTATGILLPQFHGDESPEYCAGFRRPYIKAIRMAPNLDPDAAAARYPDAAACLFDAWHPRLAGGTGEVFDWARLPSAAARPLILAGGLTPENVARAVREVRPYAVDVSSGVEVAPGHKDARLIREFVTAVHAA